MGLSAPVPRMKALVSAIATTSGTAFDLTNIPAGVKRIHIGFNGVSTNGTSPVIAQLGTTAAIESAGYSGASGVAGGTDRPAWTTGILCDGSNLGAADVRSGVLTISSLDDTGTKWVASGSIASVGTTNRPLLPSGIKVLSGALTRIRITTQIGTETFDAGSINLLWEF